MAVLTQCPLAWAIAAVVTAAVRPAMLIAAMRGSAMRWIDCLRETEGPVLSHRP